jgi:hypothetical protein
MRAEINETQLEILKVLDFLRDEKDLAEIKSLLLAYLSDKVFREADAAFDQKKYTTEVFEKWKEAHFRKSH